MLETLKAWAGKSADKTLIAFLGDNAYENGLVGIDPQREMRSLDRQLDVLRAASDVKGLFIPGNHDWASGGETGLAAVVAQRAYVERLPAARFLPRDGHPGPVLIDLPDSATAVVRVVVVDTQWWLHRGTKPSVDRGRIVADLRRAYATELPVVLLAHHPLQSTGNHGGFFDWRDYLFPVTRATDSLWAWLIPAPFVYPLARRHTPLGSEQDLFSAGFERLRSDLERGSRPLPAGQAGRPVLYAGGHEHNLQVMEGGIVADYLVVSGAGSAIKSRPVSDGPETLFAHEHPGFVVVDVLDDGALWLRAVEPVFDDSGRQIDVGREGAVFAVELVGVK